MIDVLTEEAYQALFTQDELNSRAFYDIGGGKWKHKYWKVIDHHTPHYQSPGLDIDIDLSLCTPLPIDSDTACLIYTSHTIEHLTDAAVSNIFKEAYRALKPGGYLRVTCPDAEILFKTLTVDKFIYETFSNMIETPSSGPGNHINWFTWPKLNRMLVKAGFSTVYQSSFKNSKHPILRLEHFDTTQPQNSLYAEARK